MAGSARPCSGARTSRPAGGRRAWCRPGSGRRPAPWAAGPSWDARWRRGSGSRASRWRPRGGSLLPFDRRELAEVAVLLGGERPALDLLGAHVPLGAHASVLVAPLEDVHQVLGAGEERAAADPLVV